MNLFFKHLQDIVCEIQNFSSRDTQINPMKCVVLGRTNRNGDQFCALIRALILHVVQNTIPTPHFWIIDFISDSIRSQMFEIRNVISVLSDHQFAIFLVDLSMRIKLQSVTLETLLVEYLI